MFGKLFYYLCIWSTMLILRIVFLPFRLILKFLLWIHRVNREHREFLRADYDRMDGWEFEKYVAELLVKNGYRNVEVTSGSKDQGVDVLASKDEVSYAIQCKNYATKIPNKAVQEAYAGANFYGCDVPVVLTNNYFSNSALELGDRIGVELWDRDELKQLIRKL